MKKSNDNRQSIIDILAIDDQTLALETIEAIARDANFRRRYENRYKNSLYSTMLQSLTHEPFIEREAVILWDEIIDHMGWMNRCLGRNVGVAVASMDYLFNIKDRLSDPKIIEEKKIGDITATTIKDKLTQLFIRDVFDILIEKEIHQAKRNNTSPCLLLIDIDDFKKVNDAHGHLQGDEVLGRIGATINQSVRKMDIAARYGGEELVIIMPNTGIDYARQAGERIRKAVEKLQFNKYHVTISIGISAFDKSIDTPADLIQAADRALYQAKKEGKNCIMTG